MTDELTNSEKQQLAEMFEILVEENKRLGAEIVSLKLRYDSAKMILEHSLNASGLADNRFSISEVSLFEAVKVLEKGR